MSAYTPYCLTLDRAGHRRKKSEMAVVPRGVIQSSISAPLSLSPSPHDFDTLSHGYDSEDYQLSGIRLIRAAKFPAMTRWPSK